MSGRTKQAFFAGLFDGMTDGVVFEQVLAPALERALGVTGRPGTRKTVSPSGRSTGALTCIPDKGPTDMLFGA